jgi:hypothetical protein
MQRLAKEEKGKRARRCGTSRPMSTQAASQRKPRPALKCSTRPGPRQAASAGSASMAPALPRYMPLVASDTARARSCGGTHCSPQDRFSFAITYCHILQVNTCP